MRAAAAVQGSVCRPRGSAVVGEGARSGAPSARQSPVEMCPVATGQLV